MSNKPVMNNNSYKIVGLPTIKAAFLILSALFIFSAKISSAQTIAAGPQNLEIEKNTGFDVALSVDSVSNLTSVYADLDFDPTVFEYVGIDDGGFFSQNGCFAPVMAALAEGIPGKLIFGQTQFGCDPVSGSGYIAIFHFKSLDKTETSNVSFSIYGLTNADWETITGNGWNSVSVTIKADQPPVDTEPPIITLNGMNAVDIYAGSTYVDVGATASDDVDGNITDKIIISNPVNVNTVGSYAITYNVSDAAGNTAEEVTRTVIVSDLAIFQQRQSAVGTNSVTITWITTHSATSRVIWDTISHTTASTTEAGPLNYGYANSTVEIDNSPMVTSHSVVISGLSAGTTYYFRSVSHGSPEVVGDEIVVTTSVPPTPAPVSSGGGGGGGGGGGSVSVALPTNYSIKINNNATSTDNRNVRLTLAATNASQMMISNNPAFTGVNFETYATIKDWTSTEGVGQKTVYVRFRSSSGGTADAFASINLTASVIVPLAPSAPNNTPQGQVLGAFRFADGAMIRAIGDIDVYIVKYVGNKQFKRLILSPSVFNSYGHLKWENVLDVEKSVVDSFVTSELVRAVKDTKVYKMYPSGDTGQKRWIKTAEGFNRMGFDWDAIYEINAVDRDSYVTGAVIE